MKEIDIDAIDLRLLKRLQEDAGQSNQALADSVGISPATSLRRVKRLLESGLIERQIAILQPQRLAQALGHGLTVVCEISLDQQGAEHQTAFEALAIRRPEVQQCYRVSPGPDFVLIVHTRDMPHYHALAQQLFTQHANVRNVKAYFSTHRAKFDPQLPLPDLD